MKLEALEVLYMTILRVRQQNKGESLISQELAERHQLIKLKEENWR